LCLYSLRMRNGVTQQCLEITWHVFSVGPARAPMDWLIEITRCVFCRSVSLPRLYKWAELLRWAIKIWS
jgi:hypothetical protein